MKITVHLFSVARDLAGFEEKTLIINENATISSVYEFLVNENPQFVAWKSTLRFAVNHEYVENDHILQNGDEVAVIPPVSGG